MFKVGDWVYIFWNYEKHIGKIIGIEDGFYIIKFNKQIEHAKDIELWQPQEGEWCWFGFTNQWHPSEDYTFGQLLSIESDGTYTFLPIHSELENCYGYDFCEPFIGELPSFVKDK